MYVWGGSSLSANIILYTNAECVEYPQAFINVCGLCLTASVFVHICNCFKYQTQRCVMKGMEYGGLLYIQRCIFI